MDKAKLTEILRLHKLYRDGDVKGERADFQGADFRNADLWGADLMGADLRNADLWGADLMGADLRNADLRGSDLRNADFQGADLMGADLRNADLRGADLKGANHIWSVGPLGSRSDFLYCIRHEEEVMFKTGCFWGTKKELIAAVKKTHKGKHATDYIAAIKIMETLAKE
jgi:hypothetical protein